MAYIGKTPTVGNFVKLDAITASATASYTMQVDSVNFSPESVNHMLVSLNGVIQAPTTSYTISGSTITFASALTSSDSIDFIMVYGNVLDIGTPSDATVTNAKTNFVSTSSAAGLQIKGDGTTDGTLQLNCSQNSHGIKLKSPPHSASASYTLTFPNNDGDASQFLQTNGSGVLTWASASSTFGSSYFAANRTSDETHTSESLGKIGINNEIVDVGGNYDTSNYRYTAPSTGYYFFYSVGFFHSNSNSQLARCEFYFKKNNSSYVAEQHIDFRGNNGRMAGCTLNAILSLSAGDYIEWWAFVEDTSGNPDFKANTGAGAAGAGNQFGGWRIA